MSKKIFAMFLAVLMVVSMLPTSAFAADVDYSKETPVCDECGSKLYERLEDVEATCENPGGFYCKCESCSNTYFWETTEQLDESHHDWTYVAQADPQYCADGMLAHYECTLSQTMNAEDVANKVENPHAIVYGAKDEDGNIQVVDKEDLIIKNDNKDTDAHYWVNDTEYVCGDEETIEVYCLYCGETKKVKLNDLSHSWSEPYDIVEPTGYGEDGVGSATVRCENCYLVKTDVKIYYDHTCELIYHEAVAATCTSTGCKAYYECRVCGVKYDKITDPDFDSYYDEWDMRLVTSETDYGYYVVYTYDYYLCIDDVFDLLTTKKGYQIAKLDHTYADAAKLTCQDTTFVCDVCHIRYNLSDCANIKKQMVAGGHKVYVKDSYDLTPITLDMFDSCVDTVDCVVCEGTFKADDLFAVADVVKSEAAHVYKDFIKEWCVDLDWTCTVEGCGHTMSADEKKALGFTVKGHVLTTKSGEVDCANPYAYCKYCEKTTEDLGLCVVDDSGNTTAKHNYVYVKGSATGAATCTTGSWEIRTCTQCGQTTRYYYKDAKGHDYKTIVVPATCQEYGYTIYYCTRDNCAEGWNDDFTAFNFTEAVSTYKVTITIDGEEYELTAEVPEGFYLNNTYCLISGNKLGYASDRYGYYATSEAGQALKLAVSSWGSYTIVPGWSSYLENTSYTIYDLNVLLNLDNTFYLYYEAEVEDETVVYYLAMNAQSIGTTTDVKKATVFSMKNGNSKVGETVTYKYTYTNDYGKKVTDEYMIYLNTSLKKVKENGKEVYSYYQCNDYYTIESFESTRINSGASGLTMGFIEGMTYKVKIYDVVVDVEGGKVDKLDDTGCHYWVFDRMSKAPNDEADCTHDSWEVWRCSECGCEKTVKNSDKTNHQIRGEERWNALGGVADKYNDGYYTFVELTEMTAFVVDSEFDLDAFLAYVNKTLKVDIDSLYQAPTCVSEGYYVIVCDCCCLTSETPYVKLVTIPVDKDAHDFGKNTDPSDELDHFNWVKVWAAECELCDYVAPEKVYWAHRNDVTGFIYSSTFDAEDSYTSGGVFYARDYKSALEIAMEEHEIKSVDDIEIIVVTKPSCETVGLSKFWDEECNDWVFFYVDYEVVEATTTYKNYDGSTYTETGLAPYGQHNMFGTYIWQWFTYDYEGTEVTTFDCIWTELNADNCVIEANCSEYTKYYGWGCLREDCDEKHDYVDATGKHYGIGCDAGLYYEDVDAGYGKHTYVTITWVELPDCNEPDYDLAYAYCAICGQYKYAFELISEVDRDDIDLCTEYAYEMYTCYCGEIHIINLVGNFGHNWTVVDRDDAKDAGLAAVESTCTTQGYHWEYCSDCNPEQKRGAKTIFDQFVNGEITYEEYHKLTGCTIRKVIDPVAPHLNDYNEYFTDECGDKVVNRHCVNCCDCFDKDGNYIGDEELAKGEKHVCDEDCDCWIEAKCHYVSVIVEPTCTTDGYTYYVCDGCGAEKKDAEGNLYTELYIKANGHIPTIVDSVLYENYNTYIATGDGKYYEYVSYTAPTTTETGLCSYYCSVCEEFVENEVIPMLGGLNLVLDAEEYTYGSLVTVTLKLSNLNEYLGAFTARVCFNNKALAYVGMEAGSEFLVSKNLVATSSDTTTAIDLVGTSHEGKTGSYLCGDDTLVTLYFRVITNNNVEYKKALFISTSNLSGTHYENDVEVANDRYVICDANTVLKLRAYGDFNGSDTLSYHDVLAAMDLIKNMEYDVTMDVDQDGEVTMYDLQAILDLVAISDLDERAAAIDELIRECMSENEIKTVYGEICEDCGEYTLVEHDHEATT